MCLLLRRDEIIHLIAILNSKVVDEQEKNQTCVTAERDNERAVLLHDTPRKLSERKRESMPIALPGPSTPIPESIVSHFCQVQTDNLAEKPEKRLTEHLYTEIFNIFIIDMKAEINYLYVEIIV